MGPVTDMWKTIAAERGALVDDLTGLGDERWATPSWCEGWTVRDVVAHMAATASTTPVSFFTGLAKARFNFDRFIETTKDAQAGNTPADTLAAFARRQNATDAPPGPKASWLGETLIHAEDVRRPLGIAHAYPIDAVRAVADFYRGSNTLIGAKSRIAGLRLAATDDAWTHGDGPEVSGPLMSLVLAMTGRAQACADLTGPGVDTLRERCR